MKEKPGGWFELQVPMNDGATVMKHLMPGKLIPQYQITSKDNILNTFDVHNSSPINLIINRDENGYAAGKLFLDDGETLSQL